MVEQLDILVSEAYLETFFYLSCEYQSWFDSHWNDEAMTAIKEAQGLYGSAGIFNLIKDWTEEFEERYPIELFQSEELDYYETIEQFFKEKNKE